jgi:hypothetical protein
MTEKSQQNTSRIRLGYEGLKAGIMGIGSTLATVGTTLLRWLGWLGLFVTLAQSVRNFFSEGKTESAQEILLERTREKVESLNEEYKTLLEVQMAVEKGGQVMFGAAIGQTAQALSTDQNEVLLNDYKSFSEKYERLQVGFLKSEVNRLNDHAKSLREQAKNEQDGLTQARLRDQANIASADATLMQGRLERLYGQKTLQTGYGFLNFTDESDRLSKSDQEATAFIEARIAELEGFRKKFGFLPKSYEDHLNTLQNLGKVSSEEFNKSAAAAAELGMAYKNLSTLAKDTSDAMGALRNGLAPLTAADNALQNIGKETANINKVLTEEGITLESLTAEQQSMVKKLGLLEGEGKVASALIRIDHERALAAEAAALKVATYTDLTTKSSKDLMKARIGEINSAKKVADIQGQLNKLAETAAKTEDGKPKYNAVEQRRVEILRAQLLVAQKLAKTDSDRVKLAQELYNNVIATNMAKTDEKLIKHEQTLLSIEQKKLGLMQRQQALIKKQSERDIDQTLRKERKDNPFAYLKEDERRAELELEAAQRSKPDDIKAIEKERDIKLAQNEIEFKLLDMKFLLLEKELQKLAEEERQTSLKLQSAADKAEDPREKARLQGEANMAGANAIRYDVMADSFGGERSGLDALKEDHAAMIKSEAVDKIEELDEVINKLSDAKFSLSEVGTLSEGIKNSLADGMTQAFTGIIDGSMKAKDAFKMMAIGVLKQIAAMIAQLLVARMLMSMFGVPPMPPVGMVMPPTPVVPTNAPMMYARNGGVFDKGRRMQGYSTGGVAKGPASGYPAELHGTEAVVPLPNGKSIPVEMNRGTGGSIQSNVTVNIASDGTSKTESSGDFDAEGLSKGVAAAVKEELQRQKRSGGILSPYGVA